jgi:hypothetical protein
VSSRSKMIALTWDGIRDMSLDICVF